MGTVKAYIELTKPRIATLILIVAAASFYLARPDAVDAVRLAVSVVGIGALAFGIFALNHFLERDTDRLMPRTAGRPLPSGRLLPAQALLFGCSLTVISFLIIGPLLGLLAAGIALFTFASYLFVYTPLKKRTAYHTALGALSGATPVLLGWVSARGALDLNAAILACILFLWQFPHFLSIEIRYQEDYAAAGIRVLPVTDPTGRAVSIEILVSVALLAAVSILPYFTGLAGVPYLVGASILGAGFLASGVLLAVHRDRARARLVLRASVSYLPLLFLLLSLDVAR